MRAPPLIAGLTLGFATLLTACGREPAAPAPGFPKLALEVGLETAPGSSAVVPIADDFAPTFADGPRRAWWLVELFARIRGPNAARVEVYQADGTRVDLAQPFHPHDGDVWVLWADGQEAPQVLLLDPKDPFPIDPQRGRNRDTPGAGGRRIPDVVRLRIVVDPRVSAGDEPESRETTRKTQEQAMLKLTVEIDGATRELEAEALAELDPIEVRGDGDRGPRDAWSLRALVRALGGEEARLTHVRGGDGSSVGISAAAWDAAERVPLLRLNRRGQLKFHWATQDLAPVDAPGMRDVKALVIVTK